MVRTAKTMKNDKSHTIVKRVVLYRIKCCVLIKYAILHIRTTIDPDTYPPYPG
jgi:hypothetical protein